MYEVSQNDLRILGQVIVDRLPLDSGEDGQVEVRPARRAQRLPLPRVHATLEEEDAAHADRGGDAQDRAQVVRLAHVVQDQSDGKVGEVLLGTPPRKFLDLGLFERG